MAPGTVGSRRPKQKRPAPRPVGRPRGPVGIALLRLVHPFPSFLVAAITVGLAFLADRHASAGRVAQLGAGMLLFQFSIGITNDVVDAADDAVAKAWKPIARGAIRRERAVLLAAGCAATGLLVTITLPLGGWLIGVAGLGCGLLYDMVLKRTPLSWLPYVVAIPLLPAWVYTSVGAWRSFLWWGFPLGFLIGLSLHFANELPDVEHDRARGIRSTVQRASTRRVFAMAIACFGAAASLAVVLLLFESPGRALLAAINGGVSLVLAGRATRFLGRDGLFGMIVVASGVLAVVFLSAV